MKKLSLFILLIVFHNVFAQLTAGTQTITVGGREVDVITPSNYNPAQSYPVVFFLHGLGGNKQSMQDANAVSAAQIIGVFPEGTASPLLNGGRAWNSLSGAPVFIGNVDDVAHLNAVYTELQTRLGITFNADKVYSVGFSNGASMNLKMVKYSTIFKAVVIGAMSEEQGANGTIPPTASKVPMLWMIGMQDQVVPFDGGQGSFGPLANFESVRTAFGRWALHNTGQNSIYQQLTFEGNSNVGKYYFREFRDEAAKKASLYLYMLPDGPHDFSSVTGFNLQNILTTTMRFFNGPLCYGFSRKYCEQNNIIR